MFLRFLKDDCGATAVEYGMIITVLSLVVVGGIGDALEAVKNLWASNNGHIQTNMGGS